MTTHIFSVVNQKGGVGKTTSAINLSSFLAQQGFKTLLLDLDSQSNATSGVGIISDELDSTIYDVLISKASITDAIYPTAFDNLHILPSNKELAGAEVEIVKMVSRETILKKSLAPIIGHYDFIIIDCPPSLGVMTLNALIASHFTIIPVQCEYFALEGLANLINTMTLVKDNYNAELEILGIILTMYDSRTTLNRQVVDNAKRFFDHLVFDTIIPRNIRLTEAPSHGLPILLYSPDSKGALAYYNLTQEVIKRV